MHARGTIARAKPACVAPAEVPPWHTTSARSGGSRHSDSVAASAAPCCLAGVELGGLAVVGRLDRLALPVLATILVNSLC